MGPQEGPGGGLCLGPWLVIGLSDKIGDAIGRLILMDNHFLDSKRNLFP